MTANLPTVNEPIAGSLTASVNWRRFFQRVQQALQDGTLNGAQLAADFAANSAEVAADIAAIATALGSPDGTVESIPSGHADAVTYPLVMSRLSLRY